MARPLPLRFLRSVSDLTNLPPSRTEITFVGRSNVGKSSLINALANRKNLAHVSKTPGRTQMLNCYEVADGVTVVDCPGYGFAAAPGQVRGKWPRMIEGYLLGREPLTMIVVLVDGEIGPTKLDLQMLEWLRSHERPHTVVATKHDKVRSTKRDARKRELATACSLEPGDVVWVSVSSGVGIDRLQSLVNTWLELR